MVVNFDIKFMLKEVCVLFLQLLLDVGVVVGKSVCGDMEYSRREHDGKTSFLLLLPQTGVYVCVCIHTRVAMRDWWVESVVTSSCQSSTVSNWFAHFGHHQCSCHCVGRFRSSVLSTRQSAAMTQELPQVLVPSHQHSGCHYSGLKFNVCK